MLKRTVQRLEMTIETMSKKMERESLSRNMPQLPPQIHHLGSVPPNRPAPLQLNAGLLSAPTRPAPQLSADTTNNLTGSSAARPGISSSNKSSTGVTISKPPTPTTPAGPDLGFQGSSYLTIRTPPTPTASTLYQKATNYSHKHWC